MVPGGTSGMDGHPFYRRLNEALEEAGFDYYENDAGLTATKIWVACNLALLLRSMLGAGRPRAARLSFCDFARSAGLPSPSTACW